MTRPTCICPSWRREFARRSGHALISRIYRYREIDGATLEPMSAYLLLRGMKTLHIARGQMRGFGGMLSVGLVGEFEAVRKFVRGLRYAHAAANPGAVETVICPPATSSHVELTADERAALGIPEGLIRYSAGIEDIDDLIADLDQALAGI